MKHVVKFSGGVASAVMAKIVANEQSNVILLYHSTKTEPPDNDRFRKEVATYIGLPITEVSDGRDIWEVFEDEKFLGNQRLAPCSRILKQEIGDTWIKENLPCKVYFGYTIEEKRRAQQITSRIETLGASVGFPLIEQGLSKDDCFRQVKSWGVRLPQMYSWAGHANCVPCVKGGLAYWGEVYLNAPDAWEKAAAAEEKFGRQILKTSRYGTLREELPHCLELAAKRRDKKETQ